MMTTKTIKFKFKFQLSLNLRNWTARNHKLHEQLPVVTGEPELTTAGAAERLNTWTVLLRSQKQSMDDGLHFISASQEGPALSGQRVCKESFWLSSSWAGRYGVWAANHSSHILFPRDYTKTFHMGSYLILTKPYVVDTVTHILQTRELRFQEKGGQWLLAEHLPVPTYG